MHIIFALRVGVSMGSEKKVPQEGKRLAVNKVVASSKMIDYDSDYDEGHEKGCSLFLYLARQLGTSTNASDKGTGARRGR